MTLGSFRKFQSDDYLMVIVLCFYTSLIVTINIVRDTSSNLLPPGFDVNSLTKQDIHEREYGSKLILVVEQCQCATIWGAKLCLIILYHRLTELRKENIAIKILFGYVVISFIVMDILYFGVWCQPFHNYWAVPTPNPQCDAATHHLITNAVFNLSSDCAMLAIGLPMFVRIKLPLRKKIPIVGIFSLGIFTILAAILNKVYSFTEPFGAAWTYWYTRESSTALLVANLPFVWTLWRRIAGMKRVNGVPRLGSGTHHEGTGNGSVAMSKTSPPTDSKLKSPMTAGDWLSRDSLTDLEMVEGFRSHRPAGGMTFAEMLKDESADISNSAEKGSEDPTPYTHPQLFYAKNKSTQQPSSSPSYNPHSRIEKAVLSESPELETVRRASNSPSDKDGLGNGTPASSVFPSLENKRSAGSFV